MVRRAMVRFLVLCLLLPLILFGAAGRMDWTMGWVFVLIVLCVGVGTRVIVRGVTPCLAWWARHRFSFPERTLPPAWNPVVPWRSQRASERWH